MRKTIRITHGDIGNSGKTDLHRICDFLNAKDGDACARLVEKITKTNRHYYGVVWNAPPHIWAFLPKSYRENMKAWKPLDKTGEV